MKIKRNIFNTLCEQINKPEISILLGARQVGKTFLLKELEFFCKKKGKKTQYLNLENPNDLYELSGDEITVYNKLISYPPGSILFIYEFHYLKNASKTFKAIYDSKHNIKIFASGSSSLEIHKHLKESLVGRLIKNYIYPLSYNELSQLKNMDEDYFYIYGGMPEA